MLHIKQISPLGWAMYVDSTLFAAVIALLVCFFLKLDDDGGHPLSRASLSTLREYLHLVVLLDCHEDLATVASPPSAFTIAANREALYVLQTSHPPPHK